MLHTQHGTPGDKEEKMEEKKKLMWVGVFLGASHLLRFAIDEKEALFLREMFLDLKSGIKRDNTLRIVKPENKPDCEDCAKKLNEIIFDMKDAVGFVIDAYHDGPSPKDERLEVSKRYTAATEEALRIEKQRMEEGESWKRGSEGAD